MYKVATAVSDGVSSSDRLEIVCEVPDDFIARMEALESHARGRRREIGPPPRRLRKPASQDDRTGRTKIDLVLYTSPSSEKSQKALRTVRAVLADYEPSQIKFTVCDMAAMDGDGDSVIFTPTLVKRSPGPRTWIVGNLEHVDVLIDLLDVSGVDRRRA